MSRKEEKDNVPEVVVRARPPPKKPITRLAIKGIVRYCFPRKRFIYQGCWEIVDDEATYFSPESRDIPENLRQEGLTVTAVIDIDIVREDPSRRLPGQKLRPLFIGRIYNCKKTVN